MSEANSRRNLLRSVLNRGLRAAADEAIKKIPTPVLRRRPPGAVSEMMFLERCTACGDCIKACPHYAVFKLADTVSPGAGTPVMVPDQRACAMCDGWPCAAACEPQALVVPAAKTVKIGTVRVAKDRCMVFRGPECGACAGLCPDGGNALTLTRGRPQVDESTCIGCGLCIIACPTTPAAIDLLPLLAPATSEQRTSDAQT